MTPRVNFLPLASLFKILTQLDRIGGFELTQEETSGYRLNATTGEVSEFQWQISKACDCWQV